MYRYFFIIYLILEEKFVHGEGLPEAEFHTNEAKKDAYKEQFFTREDIEKKRQAILSGKEKEFADAVVAFGVNLRKYDVSTSAGNTLKSEFWSN